MVGKVGYVYQASNFIYLMAWNALVENQADFMEQWTEKFIEYTNGAKPLTQMNMDFMLKTLDHIKVLGGRNIVGGVHGWNGD